MTDKEILFWESLTPSITTIFSVLIGSLIGVFANHKLKKKESQLRILEKVFEKRLKAYEDSLDIVKSLRMTISTYSVDNDNNLITYPRMLNDKSSFDEFHGQFYLNANYNSHWLDLNVLHELYFVQDYLQSLSSHLIEIDEDYYPEIGKIIKHDFIDMAVKLEDKLLMFFDKDIYSINIKTKKGHHKFSRDITSKRLNDSLLLINKDIISSFKTID